MAEWRECSLESVCSRLSSGKGISAKLISDNGSYPVYGGNGIRGYTHTSNFIGDCAIVGRQGAYCGNVRFFRGEAYMTEHAVVVCANEDNCTRYLAYLLSTMNLGRLSGQSAQPGLSVKTLGKQKIRIPEKEVQIKCADLLGGFDEKISHNEEINKNLEEQAQSLFKSWFIDAPESSSWETGTFSDIIETMIAGDWGKDSPTGNNTEMVYCIRGADIPDVKSGNKGKMPTRFILPKNYAAKHLVAGDVVVEISGGSPTQSTGRIASISQSLLDRYDKGMVCTNFCKAMKPKSGYSMFVYYYWQYLYDRKVFFLYENGTTGIKNLDISGFIETEPIILPPAELVGKFDAFCHSVFDVIFANGLQNEQLANMRDVLLPKLMSGEIDVSSLNL
jgi:type I restriction enzyme S subunit